jgi:hypothetical protein
MKMWPGRYCEGASAAISEELCGMTGDLPLYVSEKLFTGLGPGNSNMQMLPSLVIQ